MISFSPQERGISAVTARLELATSGLTGQRFDLLSYATMDLRWCFRWHEETPVTFLSPKASRRLNDMPSGALFMIAKDLLRFPPYESLRDHGIGGSPTGSRTLFRGLKGRDLTHRRWGRD